ncbi:hypothetical protein [Burkholderia cenocepacia]|uniref:hypothetical protein n=1 Tax=Burkholderia cenocepacia TaxID=95486 RepID=UPI0021AB7D5B|nr:hypothetical protein [Burkholderia cenocepacia]
MKSDSSRYCFPDLPEAFFIVVVLNMIEYLMNSIFLSADRSAGPQAIASIGRAFANGLVFTVLLHHGKSTYRSLLHDSVDFGRTTIGRFLVPVLLTTPALVVAMSVLEVGVGQFFPWSGTRDEARDAYIHGGLGLIVLTCMIAPLLEEMQRDGEPARGLADFLVVRRARVGRCRRMGGKSVDALRMAPASTANNSGANRARAVTGFYNEKAR